MRGKTEKVNRRFRIHNVYDALVWFLLIWCVFQDFFLCIFLRFTGMTVIAKLMFFSKDIILVGLFVSALYHLRINVRILIWYLIYFAWIGISAVVSLEKAGGDLGFTSFLSAIRGLILLPTLTLVGYSIRDKKRFIKNIQKYYLFLVVIAAIGILEFVLDIVVGTKSFWMDFLRLDDFYQSIKGASAGLENGTPGNWYTDIGRGYRTQKRLISIWAAPLTAGYIILLPCLFYALSFFRDFKFIRRKFSRYYIKTFCGFFICAVALALTFTRQVLLPALVIIYLSFLYYQKKNRKALVIGSIVFTCVAGLMTVESIMTYIYNGSTMVHIMRMEEAICQMSILGSGIGSYGTRFAGAIATESQYLTLMGQLGIFSIIPYLVILVYPIVSCKRKVKRIGNKERIVICSLCFSGICVVFAGLLSETVAAFTSMAQYYVLIGFAWGYCKKFGTEKKNGRNKSNCDVPSTISSN